MSMFADAVKAGLNIDLTPLQREQFDVYRSLLLEKNKRLNLTAVRTPAGIDSVHFLDSLSCTLVTGSLAGQSLIDVGTGAGFPGLPLKILFPTMRLTLLESVQKKARFLQEVVDALGLEAVRVLAERAEDVGRDPDHREQYDWATARAVAELRVLAEYLSPLCRVGGRVLAMKGPSAAEELAQAQPALAELNLQIETTTQLPALLADEKVRYLMLFNKVGELSERYPRRAGMPSKRPLS